MSCLRIACVVAVLLGTATSHARGDLLWGVNGHPFTAYPGVPYARSLDFVRDLGMKSYRVNIRELKHSPDWLHNLVQEGKARGVEILPVLTPEIDLDQETPQNAYQKAYQFAHSLVSRFKQDIRVWELGNELENYAIIQPCEMQDDGVQYNCSWGAAGGVGVLEYYGPRWAKVSAVLKGLSDATVAVDPSIRKAIGTAGWGHLGAFTRMRNDGIRWDISVWHMYGTDPEWAFQFLKQFNLPIWVTEFNHPGGSEKGQQQQAEGLARSVTRLRELQQTYNVEAAHVYELMDETYWAPGYEAVMGLVELVKDEQGNWRPGPPKQAYHTLKALLKQQ